MNLVSVIMPVYNLERYIANSIESILKQSYSNFELIIVDDCSTDNSYKIAQSFRDERIRLFRNSENRGVVYSRNFAISEARGEYIALNDGDDISHPKRLEYQVLYMEQHPEIGVCGTFAFIIDSEGKIRDDMRLYSNPDELRIVNMFTSPFLNSSTMTRSHIMKRNPYNENFPMGQDSELWLRLCTQTQFYTIQKRLVLYRIHDFNARNRIKNNMQSEIRRQLSIIRSNTFLKNSVLKELYLQFISNTRTYDQQSFRVIDMFFSTLLQDCYLNNLKYYRVYYRKYSGLLLSERQFKILIKNFVVHKYPFLLFRFLFIDILHFVYSRCLILYHRDVSRQYFHS